MDLTRDELRDIVRETVRETLVSLGADVDNPREMQHDLQALREWRLSMETIRKKAVLTMVGLLVTGILAATWMGLRSYFGR